MSKVLATVEHRELFQFAVRENITLEEARRRRAAARWEACDRRLAARRCGSGDNGAENTGRELAWWQK